MSIQLIYDAALMDGIVSNYTLCVTEIEEALVKLNDAKAKLLDSYKGQGTEVVTSTFSKTEEHLNLLRDCCLHAGQFVSFSKDSMIQMDEFLSKLSSIIGEKG